jgi:hypothetical protein
VRVLQTATRCQLGARSHAVCPPQLVQLVSNSRYLSTQPVCLVS